MHFHERKCTNFDQVFTVVLVPKGPINNIPTLAQIMAWRPPGDKPLSEPMMVSLRTHICATRPQWVLTNGYLNALLGSRVASNHGIPYVTNMPLSYMSQDTNTVPSSRSGKYNANICFRLAGNNLNPCVTMPSAFMVLTSRTKVSLSSTCKDSNYLCHCTVEKRNEKYTHISMISHITVTS